MVCRRKKPGYIQDIVDLIPSEYCSSDARLVNIKLYKRQLDNEIRCVTSIWRFVNQKFTKPVTSHMSSVTNGSWRYRFQCGHYFNRSIELTPYIYALCCNNRPATFVTIGWGNGLLFDPNRRWCISDRILMKALFLWVELTMFKHWFRQWLGADQAKSHYLNQWWLVYLRIYASLGLGELRPHFIMRSRWPKPSTICTKFTNSYSKLCKQNYTLLLNEKKITTR